MGKRSVFVGVAISLLVSSPVFAKELSITECVKLDREIQSLKREIVALPDNMEYSTENNILGDMIEEKIKLYEEGCGGLPECDPDLIVYDLHKCKSKLQLNHDE